MINLTMENLEKCFDAAMKNSAKFIGVKIRTEGNKEDEIIINPNANFENKLAYYKNAYTDDLVLKSFNGISIIGFTYGNCFDDIEIDLLS